MPIENEEGYDKSRESGSSNFKTSLFKPLPHIAGESFVNELVIPVFSPKNWEVFNHPPETREKLGLTEFNPFAASDSQQQDLITFYLRVSVHSVKNYSYPDGRTGFASVVCPNEFNKYLSQVAGRPKLFKSDHCPFCTAAQSAWGQYNARWKEIEQERGILKKDLTQEGRRDIAKQDDVLKHYYEQARSLSPVDRYVFSVFDHSKFSGERPMDGETDELKYQVYFAPKTIFTHLVDFWKEDSKSGQAPFFSIEDPEGFRIIKVKKNTEECRGGNLRDTKYTVMMGQRFQYSEEWQGYLKDIDNMADPSPYLNILTPSEMEAYANTPDNNAMSYNAPPVQQQNTYSPPPSAPPTGFQPPVASSAPAYSPPPSVADASPVPSVPSVPQATQPSMPVPPVVPSPPQNAPSPVPSVPQVPQVTTGMPQPPASAPSVPDRTPPEEALAPNRHKW
ncbi:hypothetical protein N8Z24_00135 [bacterium]|nr:hypothetical protein [bacterium]